MRSGEDFFEIMLKIAEAILTVILYIFATAIGLLFSWFFLVFSMTDQSGPHQSTYIIGGMLAVAHLASFAFVGWQAFKGRLRRLIASVSLVLPAFAVTIILWGVVIGWNIISLAFPESSIFTSECRTAGAQYYRLPSSPVHSIAYVWEGNYERSLNSYTLFFRHHCRNLGFTNLPVLPHPKAIEFTERGPKGGPYIHYPHLDDSGNVGILTADAIVNIRITPQEEARKAETEQGMVIHELTVTDRRSGDKLAYLKYVIDSKKKCACGTTNGSTLDERSFVLKAIGRQ